MRFEWDENKEQINIRKHGIDFTTASMIFGDVNRIELYDANHSLYEDRFITIGTVHGRVLILTVVYTARENSIRIISARMANQKEKEVYLHG